jgi:hypothetical protein
MPGAADGAGAGRAAAVSPDGAAEAVVATDSALIQAVASATREAVLSAAAAAAGWMRTGLSLPDAGGARGAASATSAGGAGTAG